MAASAKAKVELLNNNFFGYLLASMLAGLYVGLGVCLVFTIQGVMQGEPTVKIVTGVAFSIALSLVVIAGAELFTGNNLIMTLGMIKKTVRPKNAVKLWIVSWIGNLLGSMICAFLFVQAGGVSNDAKDLLLNATLAKTSVEFIPLLMRGILCNILVCLAIWGTARIQDGAGKLIFIGLCLMTFMISGFEHSVANMTWLSLGLMAQAGNALTFSGVLYNLGVVTLGNMIGGIVFIALPYAQIGRRVS